MASLAKGSQIIKPIGFFPIAIEVAPRDNVVGVKRSTQLILGYAAILASIIVTLAGLFVLPSPIRAAPFFMTALPVAVVFALLPICNALKRAKTFVFSAFNYVCSDFNGLTTPTASKQSSASFFTTFPGTGMDVGFGRGYFKFLATNWADFLDAFPAPNVGALIGTKTVGAISSFLKFFATRFTGYHGLIVSQISGCVKTKLAGG